MILVVLALASCGGGRVAAPPPARPIHAEPAGPELSAKDACGALVLDLEKYQACVPYEAQEDFRAWLERARLDVAALAHPGVPEADRTAAAKACRKADAALRAALARCTGGTAPTS